MPLYSDMYYNYINPLSSSTSSYSSNPPSYGSSSSNYSSLPYTPSLRSGVTSTRFLPKLTTISETPLTKHRIAALTRIAASTPKYIPPRPRHIDTSQIDVSANRFGNRRKQTINENEQIKVQRMHESNDENPSGARNTIRRDRGLVRLRTIHMPKKEEEKKPAVKIEAQNDIDPGYGSSERSSGSWRKKLDVEFDFRKEPTSPTSKTLGESFLEKYTIKEQQKTVTPSYLTIDDIDSIEERNFIRRKSGSKLPTFKEICSDISSDKLTDDLNAGELRRRASMIIEEDIKLFKSESQIALAALAASQKLSDEEIKEVEEEELKNDDNEIHKSIKLNKKIEIILELEQSTPEVDNYTVKIPLKKKKKLTAIATTCDLDPTMSTTPHTNVTSKNEDENVMRKIAETQPEKSKQQQQQHSFDLDTKLLIDKSATIPGEQTQVTKKTLKNSVKVKPQMKSEVPVAPGVLKLNPLKRDLSADDFWGMIGTRETAIFSKRKQQVIEEQKKKLIENSWIGEGCEDDAELAKVDQVTTTIDSEKKNVTESVGSEISTLINESENKKKKLVEIKKIESQIQKKIEPLKKNEVLKDEKKVIETKLFDEKIIKVEPKIDKLKLIEEKSTVLNQNDLKIKQKEIKTTTINQNDENIQKLSTIEIKNLEKAEEKLKGIEVKKAELKLEKKIEINVGKSIPTKTVGKIIETKPAAVKIEKKFVKKTKSGEIGVVKKEVEKKDLIIDKKEIEVTADKKKDLIGNKVEVSITKTVELKIALDKKESTEAVAKKEIDTKVSEKVDKIEPSVKLNKSTEIDKKPSILNDKKETSPLSDKKLLTVNKKTSILDKKPEAKESEVKKNLLSDKKLDLPKKEIRIASKNRA